MKHQTIRLVLLISILSTLGHWGFSQEIKLRFVDNFEINNEKGSTFGMVGELTQINFDILQKQILKVKGITKCQFFYNRRCFILYQNNFDIFELRSILLSQKLDFDHNTVVTNNNELANQFKRKTGYIKTSPKIEAKPPKNWIYPASFPKKPNTGNTEKDEQLFEKLKQQWVREHPEEYKTMTGVEYITDNDYKELKRKINTSSF